MKMGDSYLGMLHNDPYSDYNYYGSQVCIPAESPGPSTVQFVHPYANRPNTHSYANHPSQPSACTSYITTDQIESSQVEDSRADESRKRGNGPKKQAAKYDSFEPEEERYLVNLWVSYHERLESKDARKYWSKIVDELNAKYNHSRNVEKCKRKMKYLVDKYKERKDWNRKQSGGSIWKSPHYDKIDAVLGVRDVVTFSNVAGAGSESSNTSSTASHEESSSGRPSPAPADTSSSSAESEKESRRMRKKRKTPQTPEAENEIGKVMKTVTDQGERIAGVMEKMQEAQTKQMDMMNKFMGAMLEILNKDN